MRIYAMRWGTRIMEFIAHETNQMDCCTQDAEWLDRPGLLVLPSAAWLASLDPCRASIPRSRVDSEGMTTHGLVPSSCYGKELFEQKPQCPRAYCSRNVLSGEAKLGGDFGALEAFGT